MVLTSDQMKKAEQQAVDLGMSWLRLMENAGSAAAKEIRNSFSLENRKVVIVCGKGNNGGDGYVIARKLLEDNAQIKIISIGAPSTQSAKEMASKAESLGIKAINFQKYETLCCQYIFDADIVIDAIFGTGFKGTPDTIYCSAINAINSSNAVKISIDIPSGMECDTGVLNEIFVKPDMTVTFAAYKLCHLLYPSNEFCGNVVISSIGMPNEAFNGIKPALSVIDKKYIASLLPTRSINAHKGTCGTAGLYVGSKGFAGAAAFSSKAAVKSGVGIVNAIVPDNIYSIIATLVPEAIFTVLDDTENVSHTNSQTICRAINNSTSALIGCGLGQSESAKYNCIEVIKNCNVPLVIDADGINVLRDSIDLIKQYKSEVIITPHPKEAARLLKCTVDEVQSNRLESAKRLSDITGATIVLKGAHTIIYTPDNEGFVVCDGNPGMATAGTGDVLSGMAVAFLAQGMSAKNAAIIAVKLHAMAGDIAVKSTSLLSLTPTDMIDTLPDLYCRMYSLK